jgi:hypothetical protein
VTDERLGRFDKDSIGLIQHPGQLS